MRRLISSLVVVLAAAGCSDKSQPLAPAPPSTNAPTGPSITMVSLCCGSAQVLFNSERQIEARASYTDGSIKDVTSAATWRSSNPNVATVSSTGVVRGIAPGTFELRATYEGLDGTWAMMVYATRSGTAGAK